jgi:hypothetical protein
MIDAGGTRSSLLDPSQLVFLERHRGRSSLGARAESVPSVGRNGGRSDTQSPVLRIFDMTRADSDLYDAIVEATCTAWNRLTAEGGRVASLCSFPWIQAVIT